jgi:hypothetical protein
MLMSIAFIQDDGLTFREVISGIPHDAGAVLAFVLIALFVGAIWLGSRNTAAAETPPPESQPQKPAPVGALQDPAPAGTQKDPALAGTQKSPARRSDANAGHRHRRR